MFQPSGPKSRRSWITAWKKQRLKARRLNSRPQVQASKNSSLLMGSML